MKALKCLLLAVVLFTASADAQLSPQTIARLKKSEDTLKQFARGMIFEKSAADRFMADSAFIRNLVRILKTPNSFYYPFDSIQTISKIYSPDSTFRIFTWQFMRDESYYRQRGAIQMRTADGSLKLFPLIDMEEFSGNPVDSARDHLNWVGAIYYKIVLKTFNEKKYYTLLGFDDNNLTSTRKWVEVLTFNERGMPNFGGRYFTYPAEPIKPKQPAFRFLLEYKKDARARVIYDPELDLIVFDHLISESMQPDDKTTLVPDGDFEGFKWKDGKWVYVEKIFDFKLTDGQFPMEMPLKDASGKSDEQKLLEQSEKNMQKQKKEEKKPPVKKGNNQEEY
jgi:hypothetical protein